jgi:hypothetical protein
VRKAVSIKHHVVERKHNIVIGDSKEPLILVIESKAAVHGGKVEHAAIGSLAKKKTASSDGVRHIR